MRKRLPQEQNAGTLTRVFSGRLQAKKKHVYIWHCCHCGQSSIPIATIGCPGCGYGRCVQCKTAPERVRSCKPSSPFPSRMVPTKPPCYRHKIVAGAEDRDPTSRHGFASTARGCVMNDMDRARTCSTTSGRNWELEHAMLPGKAE
ncbi:hypothetical protein HBH64_066660 [Parastagonospora nodorum]|nr:hypothetical protein HBH49_051100 [Parastagonospora nodorum]KAH4168345.1 hypothetical protein HBH43_122760 [Parastagonospora nodorum]KAH4219536.1 hypothetical protein HBI06_182280 [Parastagonospora nodorum]KAH4241111.1 hypothetical protein HBI05_104940 [Parastagonospora nodorum]KAH4272074.1 hypothetical protein HBI03_024320 [Parastagonospora nodorum]